MSASVAVLAGFASDEFNAKVYETLSSASRVVLKVKTSGQVIILSAQVWRLNSRVDTIMQDLKDLAEGRTQPQPDVEPPRPERTYNLISSIDELGRMLAYIYEQARRRRLTNNSLIAGSLSHMHKHAEDLADVADWLHVLVQEEEVKGLFARAKEEINRGDIISLSQVK